MAERSLSQTTSSLILQAWRERWSTAQWTSELRRAVSEDSEVITTLPGRNEISLLNYQITNWEILYDWFRFCMCDICSVIFICFMAMLSDKTIV